MKKLLQDIYRSHHMPGVGRQVMADGGVPNLDQIRQMMVGTAPAPSTPSPGAYTDPYGLKVAAPFVESMRDGYPVAPTPPASEPEATSASPSDQWLDKLRSIFAGHFAHGGSVGDVEAILQLAREVAKHHSLFDERTGKEEGGPVVEGDVSFLDDNAPPTFARPETQEVTKALDAANTAEAANSGPDYLKPFLDMATAAGTKGVTSIMNWPEHIKESVAQPMRDVVSAGEMATGKKPYDEDEAIKVATNLAGLAQTGSLAGEAPSGALRSGLSRPSVAPERVTNPLGMHSEAAAVARALPQQKGTIEQMLAMVRNKVNPEELHWSGVDKAFQPGQKVTAEELASHFESKLPQVQETVYGSEHPNEYMPGKPLTDEFKAHRQVMFDNYLDDYAEDMYGKPYDQLSNAELETVHKIAHESAVDTAIEGGIFIHPPGEGYSKAPRYPTYVTPGGENYREIVLHHSPSWTPEIVEKYGRYGFTGPDGKYRDYWSKADAEQASRSMYRQAGDFTESHHDEPNVLGHIRMSDMTGPQGEKILNVHEFQSDWGQKARSKGVSGNRNQLEKKLESIKEELKEAQKIHDAKIKEWQELVNNNDSMTLEELYSHPIYMEMDKTRQAVIDADVKRQLLAKKSFGVPAAPYVTSREGQHNTPGWTDLLIKRVMQEAEKGGYHKVVWDTPAEQGARYNNMPQIVKGMQGYYGDVLPRRFKKVAPEVKLGEHDVLKPQTPDDMSGSTKRPGFDVTPELLERIRKGFPAYRDGGEVNDALVLARSL